MPSPDKHINETHKIEHQMM